MKDVDTLINCRWLIPVDTQHTLLQNQSIAIKDGRIDAVLPRDQASHQYAATHQVDLSDHVVLPGLINAHTHAAMTLLRGIADDLPLMEWLTQHIWPAEAKWVGETFVAQGTLLAIAEMIKGGITCFNDMYFFPNIVAKTAVEAGMRASVGLIVLDFPSIWASNADEYIAKGIEVHDSVKNQSLISSMFAPHAPYTVSDAPLKRIMTLAEELDLPIHMHVHETAHEVAESEKNTGQRPLARLASLGLLSPRLAAVHMTQLNAEDLQLIKNSGLSIVHCPESNLKLASGMFPAQKIKSLEINMALGTDGAASNNDLDMFGEMRTAALFAKAVAADAQALPAYEVIRMATLGGAKALGLDQLIGSIELGKAADIIAVDLNHIETQPLYDPVSQLVYACSREKVSDVWIAGKHVLNNRVLTTIDEHELIKMAQSWRGKIAN
jgi:5-methylthioadenosine/S-adenosylhomocysteine deaminase